MYCFCDTAHTRFSGGYLTTPSSDVIEISLKFEKTNNDSTKQQQPQRGNLNFVELSERTLKDVCVNDSIHDCIKDLLHRILIKNSSDDIPHLTTSPLLTSATVHQQQSPAIFMNDDDIYIDFTSEAEDKSINRSNSSKRSSMKSSKSMETVLEKSLNRSQKDKSPDESKAKSVGNINDDENQKEVGDYENGESIELIFISDEFVNKVNKQEVIVLDEKDGKRRESLTNKKKLVIITDDYKEKVLRNNSIVITNERKMLKKLKQPSKTYNTNSNSFLTYDEPDANDDTIFMEDKLLGDKKIATKNE
jgi:hypothetical protein